MPFVQRNAYSNYEMDKMDAYALQNAECFHFVDKMRLQNHIQMTTDYL